MKRRWLLMVAVVAALSVTASGCSGFGGGGGGGDTPPKGTLCPGKKAPKKVKVVTFWSTFSQKQFLKSAQDFNCAHPNIAVNISVDSTAADDTNGKLLAAVSAHKPPDLTLAFDDVVAGWAAKGEVQPLDDFASSSGVKGADYVDPAWQSVNWNGKLYGVPADWDPDAMLWYNKKVFADAGLDPNKPPATWDELQAAAAKIDKIEHGKIKRLGFVPWSGWYYNYIQLGYQYGAKFETGSKLAGTTTPSVVLDSPELRNTFDYLASVAKRLGGADKVKSFMNVTGAEGAAADPLMSGRVGMLLQGDWQLSQQAIVGKDAFRSTIGVVPMPAPPGGQQYLCHSGWAFMVPTGAKHAREAMEYVSWMEESEHFATYIGQVFGWLPARKATLSQSYITSDPTMQKILEIQDQAGLNWWLAPSPILAQYYRALDQAKSAVLDGKTSSASALQAAQAQVESALKTAIANNVYKQ
jgi:multiple sugar transport system substrate-binding protein